jgi:hypothetical protein
MTHVTVDWPECSKGNDRPEHQITGVLMKAMQFIKFLSLI